MRAQQMQEIISSHVWLKTELKTFTSTDTYHVTEIDKKSKGKFSSFKISINQTPLKRESVCHGFK